MIGHLVDLAIPAPRGRTVTIGVSDGVGCVRIDYADGESWGQCGTVPWALRCAADALEASEDWVRPFDSQGRTR